MSDNKLILTLGDVASLAQCAAKKARGIVGHNEPIRAYPIPRGGVPALLAMTAHDRFVFCEHPSQAEIIVDDLIDSGRTMESALAAARMPASQRKVFTEAPAPIALIDKTDPAEHPTYRASWIVWPWEGDSVGSFEDNIRRTLQFVGEDVDREGLAETPERVAKAWAFWCKGYNENPADILKTFEDGAKGVDEMVMVRDIPFYTHCEHHMAPFFGRATIGYIPSGRIVGLSKFNRLVDCFARRLQVQERLTTEIADAIWEHLKPKGVGVVLNARHMCMESRGVCQQGHSTTTSALRGVMLDGSPRQEFLLLAK